MSGRIVLENSAYSLWSHSARAVFWGILLTCIALVVFSLVGFFTHEVQLHNAMGAAGLLGLPFV